MRVLVVDDEEGVRLILSELLQELGFEVRTAASGAAGLEEFFSDDYDIVITDRRLGDMLGEALVRKIKKENPDIKVVLMTGDLLTEDTRCLLKEAGADEIWKKPFDFQIIERFLRSLIERSDS
jgi:DNA-binding response OmpR family regulator